MKQRLLNILSVDLLNTIRVNSQLPFKQFVKFPIWVYKCKVDSLPPHNGIVIDCNCIKSGMIRLGLRTSGLYMSKNGININISESGQLIFKGPGYMGNNSSIEIGPNGKIFFGANFGITSTFRIACHQLISIGENFSCSWEVNVFDTDFHELVDLITRTAQESIKPVYIGNDVWVCQRVTILKGSYIPDRGTIGACSLVANSFHNSPLNSIFAGVPAKFLKTGYARREFLNFEKQPINNIVKYLNL